MLIEKLVVGSLEANCYLVASDKGAEAVVIDPGAEPEKILGRVRANRLAVKYIVDTHGHPDHIGANASLKKVLAGKVEVAIHRKEFEVLKNPGMDLSSFLGTDSEGFTPDICLEDGDRLEAGGLILTVIHTPGHTPGGICLLAESVLFTGDTLFAGGVGRTDLPGGSWKLLAKSIKERIFPLGDDVRIYPGHGPESTVGEEKETNPFL